MTLRHILVEHEYQALDLERQLRSASKTFQELARIYSSCPSAKDGGYLGDFSTQQGQKLFARLDETFQEAALQLSAGQHSQPVRTRFGYHLILRER